MTLYHHEPAVSLLGTAQTSCILDLVSDYAKRVRVPTDLLA